MREMKERRMIDKERGRIEIGWMIVEEIEMVIEMVMMKEIERVKGREKGMEERDKIVKWIGIGIGGKIIMKVEKVVLLIVMMMVVGRKVIKWIIKVVEKKGQRELLRIGVMEIEIGVELGEENILGV